MSNGIQRVLALVVLVAAGILSLPLAAALLDGESTENWILPFQLAVMAAIGAVVGYLLPGTAGTGAGRARGATIGAVLGVAAALVGVLLFFLLLNGFSGA
jgi:hypothetical protein